MENKIYQKLAKARVELQSRNLKKSGFNKLANFRYFELSDFLPTLNEICEKLGILTVFSLSDTKATMEVIECDTGAKIEFGTHVISAQMKGSNPIQELGATHTYLRRFLMLMAFEITDGDVIDALPGEAEKKEDEKNLHEKGVKKLKSIINEEQKTNILNHYKAKKIEELTVTDLKNIINRLEANKK